MWCNAKVAVQTLNLSRVHVADFDIGTSREVGLYVILQVLASLKRKGSLIFFKGKKRGKCQLLQIKLSFKYRSRDWREPGTFCHVLTS